MNALALIAPDNVPRARKALISLNEKIAAAGKRLATLQNGRDALASELGRAASAKAELAQLVDVDAGKLLDRLRHGTQWALSAFGNSRAKELSVALSESRLQSAVGERALEAAAEEISVLERELSEMQQRKPDVIRAVLLEASVGFQADLAVVIDDLRNTLTILAALDVLTERTNGEWRADKRLVVTLPPIGGAPEQAIVAPAAAIKKAKAVWGGFASALEKDALANVENLEFPRVSGEEDAGKIVYHEMSPTERREIDRAFAQGKTQGVK
jgi:hypothetical protein